MMEEIPEFGRESDKQKAFNFDVFDQFNEESQEEVNSKVFEQV